jgi:hypothetical protein
LNARNGTHTSFDTVPAGRKNASLLLQIARLELMPNRQNEHDVIGREPSVFRNVAMAAAREHELPSPVLCAATKERMVCQQLDCFTNAQESFACSARIVIRNKIEESLEVREGSIRYFDARHERARGRRAFFPATRAAR